MKKEIRLLALLLMIIIATASLCSCDTIKSLFEDSTVIVGNDEETRDTRIEGAQGKATNALKTYTSNITMLGIASSAKDNTVFIVEVDSYYMIFKYASGAFNTDENPDVLPMSDPYANRDDYKKIKGDAVDKIPDYVTVYEPKD